MISSVRDKFRKHQIKQEDGSYIRYYGMTEDADGNLWLGSDGNGIFKTNADGKIVKHFTADGRPGSLTDNAVLSGYTDSKGRLWFGT